jgi:hypothetical protein
MTVMSGKRDKNVTILVRLITSSRRGPNHEALLDALYAYRRTVWKPRWEV